MELEEGQHQQGEEYYKDLQNQFRTAQHNTALDIEHWYQRLADNNGISLASAKKLLKKDELEEFHWTVEQYIKAGEENAINQQWMKQLENASAKYHISYLESMKLQMQQHCELLSAKYQGSMTDFLGKEYADGFYHSVFEIQSGKGVYTNLTRLDTKNIDNILTKPWAVDGKNFSDRIWTNKEKLVKELHNELTQCLVRGYDPQKAIDNLAKIMNVSKAQAGRLIMTELAAIKSMSRLEAFRKMDLDEYEIVATLDGITSEICQEMDGRHFKLSDFEVGATAPPFHPNCRTDIAPYFDDEFDSIGERAARGEDGKTYHVPGDMTYKDWQKAFVEGDKSGLKEVNSDGTMEKKPEVKELNKLKQSGMTEAEYQEYLNIINSHSNEDVIKLYSEYADEIKKVSLTAKGGAYQPASVTLNFTYPKYADMNKYGTLAHEYGHFFDDKAGFDGLHFKEMEAVRKATGLDTTFKNAASSSDEFLAAMRSDKVHIKSILTADAKADLIAHNASSGVQDAIDGLFTKSRLCWGHGEKYYNRKYATVEQMDRILNSLLKKKLQQAYKDLGLDASNQSKVKSLCRQYEAASEAWANILSAEVCGGESLEYVKKYLPNSYQAMLNILKGVKVNE